MEFNQVFMGVFTFKIQKMGQTTIRVIIIVRERTSGYAHYSIKNPVKCDGVGGEAFEDMVRYSLTLS